MLIFFQSALLWAWLITHIHTTNINKKEGDVAICNSLKYYVLSFVKGQYLLQKVSTHCWSMVSIVNVNFEKYSFKPTEISVPMVAEKKSIKQELSLSK